MSATKRNMMEMLHHWWPKSEDEGKTEGKPLSRAAAALHKAIHRGLDRGDVRGLQVRLISISVIRG